MKSLREQIKICLEENGLQWKYDFTDLLINNLIKIVKERDNYVIGEYEPEEIVDQYPDGSTITRRSRTNKRIAEQRQRAREALGDAEDWTRNSI